MKLMYKLVILFDARGTNGHLPLNMRPLFDHVETNATLVVKTLLDALLELLATIPENAAI